MNAMWIFALIGEADERYLEESERPAKRVRGKTAKAVLIAAIAAAILALAAAAGYLGLVHTLCTELGADGIRVNAIAPGWIDTPMFHKATDNDAPRLNKILGRIPMKGVGDPMDIGMTATYLASDAARYVSGVCVPVDGGALIGF